MKGPDGRGLQTKEETTALTAPGVADPSGRKPARKTSLDAVPEAGERPFAKDPDRPVRHRRAFARHLCPARA